MKKTFLSLVAITTVATLMSSTAHAQYGQYGTTTQTPSDLSVNKKVRTSLEPFSFVENLSEGDLKYSPDTDVVFSIAVTNSGNQTFEEVKVEDLLPERIVSASVPNEYNGSYNSSDRRLTFYIKDLKAGETKTVEVTARIAKTGFKQDQSITCEINKVEVRSEDRYDDDTARYCIQTNVLGATTLPQAGLEDYLPLMPFMAMGFAGLVLTLKKRGV